MSAAKYADHRDACNACNNDELCDVGAELAPRREEYAAEFENVWLNGGRTPDAEFYNLSETAARAIRDRVRKANPPTEPEVAS